MSKSKKKPKKTMSNETAVAGAPAVQVPPAAEVAVETSSVPGTGEVASTPVTAPTPEQKVSKKELKAIEWKQKVIQASLEIVKAVPADLLVSQEILPEDEGGKTVAVVNLRGNNVAITAASDVSAYAYSKTPFLSKKRKNFSEASSTNFGTQEAPDVWYEANFPIASLSEFISENVKEPEVKAAPEETPAPSAPEEVASPTQEVSAPAEAPSEAPAQAAPVS